MRLAIILGIVGLLIHGPADADYSEREDVRNYMDGLVAEHGFGQAELRRIFADARHSPTIIESISRPAERRLKWYEYRRIFLDDKRIEQGVAFWAQNEAALERARMAYQVAEEYIVSIIGVETRFGRIMGSHRVIDALSTLAFDYPPRSDFFRKELTEFLLLVREEDQPVGKLMGSYAGAMGYGQFIPSSFRHFAVDFDGNGVRNIWTNTTDAIGSVANYFAEHGWQSEGEVVRTVTLTDPEEADAVSNQGLQLTHTVDELRQLGVVEPDLGGDTRAALMRMEQKSGPEYWLALHNFHVITRYNRSRMYALAVHQLAQAIRARRQSAVSLAGISRQGPK